jgi:hypothetical protein
MARSTAGDHGRIPDARAHSGRSLRPAIRPLLAGQPCPRRRTVDCAVHGGRCGHARADASVLSYGGGEGAVRMVDVPVAAVARGPTVCRAGLPTTRASCRTEAGQAAGRAVHRALYHRHTHHREGQNARHQGPRHTRDRRDDCLDPRCVGRRLAAGRAGAQKPQGAGDQHQHAQRRHLLADRRPLLLRHGGHRPDPGVQRHCHPTEYAVRAHDGPPATRPGGTRRSGREWKRGRCSNQ